MVTRMSINENARALDTFGPFQWHLFRLVTLPLVMLGFLTMSVIVTFAVPDHRCRIPELGNGDTFAIQSDRHLSIVNCSVPRTKDKEGYSKCLLYSAHNVSCGQLSGTTNQCDSWVYDHSQFDNTIATQFDLVCDKKGFRAVYNVLHMAGLVVGSVGGGMLCDMFGRKKIFVISFVICTLSIIIGAFPVVRQLLLVYRFITATTGIVCYLAIFVLCIELVNPTHRALAGTMVLLLWLIGPYTVALLSFWIRKWVYLQLAGSVPFLLCIFYFRWIPESPRWLITKGRIAEAEVIIENICKKNHIKTFVLQSTPETDTSQSKTHSNENSDNAADLDDDKTFSIEKPIDIFKYPNLIVRCGIIFFNWSAISMVYFGLSLNVTNLSGSVRLNFFLSNTFELVGYILAWLLLNRAGRKRLHCTVMILAGTVCLCTVFPVLYGGSHEQWITTALFFIGKMGISAAFSSIYLMTGELFPTFIRNGIVGAGSCMGRIASLLSPFIADLGLYLDSSLGQALPMIIFGTTSLAAGLLAFFLPETLHSKLPSTFDEASNITSKTVNHAEKTLNASEREETFSS